MLCYLLLCSSVNANNEIDLFSVDNQNAPFNKTQENLLNAPTGLLSANERTTQLAILYFQYNRIDLLQPLLKDIPTSPTIAGVSLKPFLHGYVHFYAGRYNQAKPYFKKAANQLAHEHLASEADLRKDKWLAVINMYNAINNAFLQQYTEAIKQLANIRVQAEQYDWKTIYAKADYLLGQVNYELKAYEDALNHFNRAEASYPITDTLLIAEAMIARAQMINIVGSRQKAFELLYKAIETFEQRGDISNLAFGYLLKSYFFSKDNQPAKALTWIEKSVKLREQLGNDIDIANAYVHYSGILKENQLLAQSAKYAKKAADLVEGTDDITGQWDAFGNLAMVLHDQGKYKSAFEYMHKAERALLNKARLDITTEAARLNSEFSLEIEKLKNQTLDDKNALLQSKLALEAQKQKLQNWTLMVLSIALIFIIAVVFLIYYLYSKNRQLAIQDPLTKLHNRRYIMNIGKQYFTICKRYTTPMTVVMLDIDNFKQVNDQHGHKEGDNVLVFIANLCKQTLRSSDFVGRIGGEEFLFILPNTTEAKSVQFAQRLCNDIRETSVKQNLAVGSITVSLGLAHYEDFYQDFSELVNSADIALYQAKANGRNQVTQFDFNMNKAPLESEEKPKPVIA